MRGQNIDTLFSLTLRAGSGRTGRPIARLGIPGKQLSHPGELLVVLECTRGGGRLPTFVAHLFVTPVRSHPVFSKLVHGLRTDLHLKGTPSLVRNNGVQGPIAIGLRARDIVIELIGDRHPPLMHQA